MTIQAWVEFTESKNKAEILRQLQDLGYEITQRTFYRHCAQGKCRKAENGLYTRRLVKAYVNSPEGPARTGGDRDDQDGPNDVLSIEKYRQEILKIKNHNRMADLEYKKKEGLLIEREALYLELAARVVTLDNGFMQSLEMQAPEIIAAIGGDISRTPEFIAVVTAFWHELLNTYATTDEFEVLFEDAESESSVSNQGE
jgi:hypothetical protein